MENGPGLSAVFLWLEGSVIGETVRLAPNLYPILESMHILGITLLVGSAVAVDLRLLGVGRNVLPVTIVTQYLLPVSHIGFGLAAATGVTMFIGIALAVGSSAATLWKFALIGVAGVNIVIFHTGVYRTVSDWNLHSRPPAKARVAALISVFSWIGVIFAGRFLAYV